MCVGIPLRIVSADGLIAVASDGTRTETVDLSLTGPVGPGTWILTFLGAAREVLSEDEAAKISAALRGLERLMKGGSLGDAFSDLEDKGPVLPPHLAAALADGRTEA
ncbi:HypC/HybG/HupF family hydrogenase formation chaperone [Ovoidimarina sediminis]|uniref:HypC/HybG/HupF family hydrogenase formation chaperone n=1 Tax=Ovoidimarina sediminis TaxID=3079856 RepID=UPI00290F928F|nr:HypC/HybG/HupF family hydrogenase formation chaperone [Rhodophyticola sp. MJ-SS7]MDU8945449.1 HypC/HybG/HupF family hydrogenase formation chaperone [Rhodophyticola sp. MJ-SS7]